MSYEWSKEEREYMDYLDEVYGIEGYGLLLAKGDPIAFNVGFQEWLTEELGIDPSL